MSSSDFTLLPALYALLVESSVTGAARRMGVSTPAMSHTLAKIRDAFGDPILVRAGRSLAPTPRAIEMREPLRQLLDDASTLMAPERSRSLATTERQFIVRAPGGVAIVYGALLLERLHDVMPLARLQIVSTDLGDLVTLRESRIDLEITARRPSLPEVITQALYVQHMVGAVRVGHHLMSRKRTGRRFSAEKHVAQDDSAQATYEDELATAGYSRNIVLRVPNAYAALLAAARSDLVATVPDSVAHSVSAALGLEVFDLPVSTSHVVQAWHPRFEVDPAHRLLRSTIHDVLARQRWVLSPMGEARSAGSKQSKLPKQ